MHKKLKEDKLIKLIISIIKDFSISLVTGIVSAIIGALFSFWLLKTYGYSILGG